MNDLLKALAGTLIVSCQAYPGEPLYEPEITAKMAESVVIGGASAVRIQGLVDILLVRQEVSVPVIGLLKRDGHEVAITPTLADCLAVAAVGAEIVAVDGTRRPRPDGLTLAETIAAVKSEFPGVLVMADCGSADDARASQDAGADVLGTTLAGYTGERRATKGPDWKFLAEMIELGEVPVYAEGRIHTPQQARKALDMGANAVVVGSAITHPIRLTKLFAAAM